MTGLATVFNAASPKRYEPFLVIEENRFAHAAVERLLTDAAPAKSRLVLVHGPSGVGKSHLVSWFLHSCRRREPDLDVVHVVASELRTFFADVSAAGALDELNAVPEVLICEDLQSLPQQAETQNLLTSLIDRTLSTGGRVLLTSRRLPGESEHLSPRLVNRCHAGATAAIDLPGRPNRARLLSHFCQTQQLAVPADVIRLVAAELAVSPRELLAALRQLDATARFAQQPIHIDFARRYLAGEIRSASPSIAAVAKAASRHFGVKLADVRSRTRRRELTLVRQCAMLLARELTDESLTTIAKYFGGRNHATAVHACARIRELLPEQPTLRQHLSQIREMLATTTVNKVRQ